MAQQKEIGRLEDLVDRFRYKATKAAMAQSKLKQIERMDLIENPEKAYNNPPRLAAYAVLVKRRIYKYPVSAAKANLSMSNGPIRYGTKLFGKMSVIQKNGLPSR